jgi:hypothetical protein
VDGRVRGCGFSKPDPHELIGGLGPSAIAYLHGKRPMFGFTVSQASVSRYMPPGNRRPGQSWRTFICNQAISFSHTRRLEQESAPEFLSLPNRSSVRDESECAGLKATPRRCPTRTLMPLSTPPTRVAERRSLTICSMPPSTTANCQSRSIRRIQNRGVRPRAGRELDRRELPRGWRRSESPRPRV